MEQAGRLIAKMKAKGTPPADQLAVAAWPAAIGKRLATKTKAIGLVRDRLVVEVEDAIWQRNLHGLRNQILKNLSDLLGERAPQDLEFKIGIPRRPPQRAEAPASRGLFADEADGIADPVLRRIYIMSRRKAGA